MKIVKIVFLMILLPSLVYAGPVGVFSGGTTSLSCTADYPILGTGQCGSAAIGDAAYATIGTGVQAYAVSLASIAGLTEVANGLIYTTADNTYAVLASSANMISLLGSADYDTARTNLGLAIGTDIPGISGTPTDEQVGCWELDGAAWKLKACGAKTTYTEPASNLPLCRTGAGTTGQCTNLTDVAYLPAAGTGLVEKLAVFYWDGGGSAITTGATTKRCVILPYAATVTGVYALADASTTSHLHVYQDAFATGARSTTVTGAVDISATLGSVDTTLTSWDKSITAADEICMSVEANNNAKWLNVTVYGTR